MGDTSENSTPEPNQSFTDTKEASFKISDETAASIIDVLEARSKKLKAGASAALLATVVLITFGGYAIWNIDQVLSGNGIQLDITPLTDSLSNVQSSLNDINKSIAENTGALAKLDALREGLPDPVLGVEGALQRVMATRNDLSQLRVDEKEKAADQIIAQRELTNATTRIVALLESASKIESDAPNATFRNGVLDVSRIELVLQDLINQRNMLEFNKKTTESKIQALQSDTSNSAAEIARLRDEQKFTDGDLNFLTSNIASLSRRLEQLNLAKNTLDEAQKAADITSRAREKTSTFIKETEANAEAAQATINELSRAHEQLVTAFASSRKTLDTVASLTKTSLEENRGVREQLTGNISTWRSTLDKTKSAAEEKQGNQLLSTLGTRAALIVLLLFLVQILVTLYRYNMRLASFYDARVDALKLAGSCDTATLGELVAHMSPEQLDFGKTPSSITEQAFQFAKEMLGRQQGSR